MKTLTEAQAKMLLGMVESSEQWIEGSLHQLEARIDLISEDAKLDGDDLTTMVEDNECLKRRLAKLVALKKALGG